MAILRAAFPLLCLAVPAGCAMDFDAAFALPPDAGANETGSPDASAGAAGAGGHAGDAATGGAGGQAGDASQDAPADGSAGAAGDGGQDAGPPAKCPLHKLQSGTAAIVGQDAVTVPIDAVDPARAFLVFGVRFANGLPGNSSVSGSLTGPTELRFARSSADPTVAIDIAWHVAEFGSCAAVQRGTAELTAASTIVSLPEAVDLSKSFPIATYRTGGTYFSDNDAIRVKLAAPNTLMFTTDAKPASGIAEWQVVTFEQAAVQSGDTLMGLSTHAESDLEPVDLDTTWLLYSYQIDGIPATPPPPTSVLSVTGSFASAQQLQFDRAQAVGTVNLTWYAVTFLHGATVRSSSVQIASGALAEVGDDPALDPEHTIPTAGGLYYSGGLTTVSTSATGAARVTLGVEPGKLVVMRGQNDGELTIDWFAVQFP